MNEDVMHIHRLIDDGCPNHFDEAPDDLQPID